MTWDILKILSDPTRVIGRLYEAQRVVADEDGSERHLSERECTAVLQMAGMLEQPAAA